MKKKGKNCITLLILWPVFIFFHQVYSVKNPNRKKKLKVPRLELNKKTGGEGNYKPYVAKKTLGKKKHLQKKDSALLEKEEIRSPRVTPRESPRYPKKVN